jgi:chromosome partitioning protein
VVRKIVLLNPKGGSGKTTIATNLAAYYASQGVPTALTDSDPQGSCSRWLVKRPETSPEIHGIATYKIQTGVTRSFALRLPADVERVIVDTPAALPTHKLIEETRGADKILVPVLPSDIDIHAVTRCIADLLLQAKIQRGDNRLAVVANRVKQNTRMFQSLMRFLASLEIPVAAVLRDSQAYIRAAEQGIGVHEMQASRVRRDLEQWETLIDWVEDRSRGPKLSLEHSAFELEREPLREEQADAEVHGVPTPDAQVPQGTRAEQ